MQVTPNLQWPTFMPQRTSSPVSAPLNISEELWRSQLSLLRYHTHLCPLDFLAERIPRSVAHKTRSDYTQWPEKPACFRELRPTDYFWQVPFHSPRIHRAIHADDARRIFRLFLISNLALKVEIYRLPCQQNDVVIWVMDICWDVMYTEHQVFP